MTKLLAVVGIFIAILGIYLAFGNKFLPKPPKYTGGIEKARVGLSKSAPELSSLIVIAQTQGYFKEEGLEIILTDEENGIIGQQNLLAGKEDIITTSEFGFVRNSFSDASSKIIATIDKADFIELIARRDKRISLPSDLKGKKIGFVSKTSLEYFLSRFLTFNNLSLKDINPVNLPFDKMQEAITSGIVDAVVANDPYAYQIKGALGAKSISWSAQNGQDVFAVAVSTDEFTKSHPQAVMRFLKAIVSANQFVKMNPDLAKQIMQDKLQFEQKYIDQEWRKNKFTVSLDQSLLTAMEEEGRFVIANILTDSPRGEAGKTIVPNYTDFIYTDALRKVSLDAVTLY